MPSAAAILLTAAGLLAMQPGQASPALIVERNVAVAMRDGVVLRADVYRPDRSGQFPVLVYRTPYGKHHAARDYSTHTKAVERGYAVILQDVRGRYASAGRFAPYQHEGTDGYDTIEWAAKRPWSNGQVGTYGLSYPGAVQWLAAIEAPPHLQAMVPAMTFSSPRNFFYSNGVFDLSWLPWIYLNVAPDARRRLELPGIRDGAAAEAAWPRVAQEYQSWLPLRELPYLRKEAPFYFEWLAHPPEDAWWDWAELRGRYSRVSAAVLNLSGWHDEHYGPHGAVTNFNGLVQARAGATTARTNLLIGPWVHGVSSTGESRAGELDFGPDSVIDYDDVVLDFLDHHLRGIANQFATAAPVRHFVMGANQWRDETVWPPAGATNVPLYFAGAPDGQPRKLRSTPPPGTPAYSAFSADPRNPVADPYEHFGPHDYQQIAARKDLLTFDSAPLREDWLVSGAIVAELYVSCDCRDFDLWVRLQDVHPDGRAINLMSPGSDVIRASYRNAGASRSLLEPGKVYRLRLANLLTSNRFARGHRIRAQVSASFAPHLSRNLQTGESEVHTSASKPARISIHHGAEIASRLLLPILE